MQGCGGSIYRDAEAAVGDVAGGCRDVAGGYTIGIVYISHKYSFNKQFHVSCIVITSAQPMPFPPSIALNKFSVRLDIWTLREPTYCIESCSFATGCDGFGIRTMFITHNSNIPPYCSSNQCFLQHHDFHSGSTCQTWMVYSAFTKPNLWPITPFVYEKHKYLPALFRTWCL